ncbi:MAG: alpha/beta hydrolase [Candidatus Schekmanbacteria bacterium]|nr:alpha/beta hydrolase [Candidatus Schekmanbacteria bacterium]
MSARAAAFPGKSRAQMPAALVVAVLVAALTAAGTVAAAEAVREIAPDKASQQYIESLVETTDFQSAIAVGERFLEKTPPAELEKLGREQRKIAGAILGAYGEALMKIGDLRAARTILETASEIAPPSTSLFLLKRSLARTTRRSRFFGEIHPFFDKAGHDDPQVAAVMRKAATGDVVLAASDALFGKSQIELGQYRPDFFLRYYGTALFVAEPIDAARIPVFLVHGINGSPQDFAEMIPRFAGTPYQPVYFFYPTGAALEVVAAALREQMKAFLGRHSPPRYAIVGHSMGGLVVKGMLDLTDVPAALPGLRFFASLSTPWTGFESAGQAEKLPDHPASWEDLYSGSAFLSRAHKTPLPEGVAFYLFFGSLGEGSAGGEGNDDRVLPLKSILTSPVSAMARDIYGFYEDHMTIVGSERVFRRLRSLMDVELGLAAEACAGR